MYFKCSIRRHPETGSISGYYRLVESYRNAEERICHRTILNVGFMEDTTAEQRNKIQQPLNARLELRQDIFEETEEIVKKYVELLWQRIIEEKRFDIEELKKHHRMIDAKKLKHQNSLHYPYKIILPMVLFAD